VCEPRKQSADRKNNVDDVRHPRLREFQARGGRAAIEEKRSEMATIEELKAKIEQVDLWSESTNEDRCDNCAFYKVLREDIGFCIRK
jgi:hypothetical protein